MNELIKVNLDTQTVSAREPSCQFSDEFIEMAIELGEKMKEIKALKEERRKLETNERIEDF